MFLENEEEGRWEKRKEVEEMDKGQIRRRGRMGGMKKKRWRRNVRIIKVEGVIKDGREGKEGGRQGGKVRKRRLWSRKKVTKLREGMKRVKEEETEEQEERRRGNNTSG